MKFGIFYEHQLPRPWGPRSEYQLLQDSLTQIELADRLGYDYAWEVEHHFLEEYSHSSAPEVFLGAASQRTKRIRLGHGVVQLTTNQPHRVAERIATLDLLSGGRVELGMGEAAGPAELHPFNIRVRDKRERWEEAVKAIVPMFSKESWEFHGQYYDFPARNVIPKPLQKPHPPLFFGGSSEGALAMGSQHCDVFAMFGEPLAPTAQRIAEFRARAAQHGRTPTFNMSFRPILGATEGEAWDRAHRILDSIRKPSDPTGFGNKKKPLDQSARRLLDFAAAGEVHDERLWMPIAEATGAVGNTSCLVGTPEQVAAAMLEYYKLGIHSFLIRGFDPFEDTIDFGRELIPRLRAGAVDLDRARAA